MKYFYLKTTAAGRIVFVKFKRIKSIIINFHNYYELYYSEKWKAESKAAIKLQIKTITII